MPGILHETAAKHALALLGPGAATKGMRTQIRSWLDRADLLDKSGMRPAPCSPESRCTEQDDGLFCAECISRLNRREVREWPIVIPDAFRIHREDVRCLRDERLFVIDAIEIDGGHVLRQKIDKWMDFGDAIDFSDWAFLRLRIFNEHFVQIGEYVEGDLCLMGMTDLAKKSKASGVRPDPGWAAVVRRMREVA